ncbi:MAG: hypothetical protein P8188_17495 [Gemmatimonadota bacterium]
MSGEADVQDQGQGRSPGGESTDSSGSGEELGAPSLVALATGGMVEGGIYVALGVVVESAGRWSWLAFTVGGVIGALLFYRLATTKPMPLSMILAVFGVSFFLRPWLLRRAETDGSPAEAPVS